MEDTHTYLTSALDWGQCSASRSDSFIPAERGPVPIWRGPGWARARIVTAWWEKSLPLQGI